MSTSQKRQKWQQKKPILKELITESLNGNSRNATRRKSFVAGWLISNIDIERNSQRGTLWSILLYWGASDD